MENVVLSDWERRNYRFTVIATAIIAVCVIGVWIASDSWWVKVVFGLVLLTNLCTTGKIMSKKNPKRQRSDSGN